MSERVIKFNGLFGAADIRVHVVIGTVKEQTINWSNFDINLPCHMTSLELYVLLTDVSHTKLVKTLKIKIIIMTADTLVLNACILIPNCCL